MKQKTCKIFFIFALTAIFSSEKAFAASKEVSMDKKMEIFLFRKGVTGSDFKKYKNSKDSYGCTLYDAMAYSLYKYDTLHNLGIRLCGPEDYGNVFGNTIPKLIQWYHGVDNTFKHQNDFDMEKILNKDLDPQGKYIISTRARVARNLDGTPFVKAQTKAQTLAVEKELSTALEGLKGDFAGKYYSLATMPEKDAKQLRDDHFLFQDIKTSESLNISGIVKDYTPEGSGIFYNQNKTFVAWVNEEDSLRIISIREGSDMFATLSFLKDAVAKLSKKLKFAYTDQYGYLTSCPTNIGTGLRASYLAKLPNLAKNPDLLREIAKKYKLDIRGEYGDGGNVMDGVNVIFDISNASRFGYTESELANQIITGMNAVINAEKELEKSLAQ